MGENTNERQVRPGTVDYVVYRDTVADNRWIVHKLIIALIVSIALLFISNMAWLYFWNQYDYSSVETNVDSEGEGIANYTGGDGGVNTYGESYSPKNNPNEADGFEGNQSAQTETVTQPG